MGARKGLSLAETEYFIEGKVSTFNAQLTEKEIYNKLDQETHSFVTSFVENRGPRTQSRPKGKSVNKSTFSAFTAAFTSSVERQRCFLVPILKLKGEKYSGMHVSGFRVGNYSLDDFQNLIRGIIHIPGLRGNPARVYASAVPGANFPGLMEQYVASVIYGWENGNAEEKSKVAGLGVDLEKLSLTWKIHAARIDDVQIELQVGRLPHAQQGGAFDLVNIADVGFGVSQILPILVALRAASSGQIVYIEQPELHLHPRAQVALASILVSAALRGVRVIAETHSSLIIRSIQAEIARKKIPSEDVGMNWFSRNPQTGNTKIDIAEIDDLGRFGDWPIDFDDIAEEADFAFLKAVGEALDE
jgi:hypothetical protein